MILIEFVCRMIDLSGENMNVDKKATVSPKPSLMGSASRRVYIAHIRRLQKQNAELTEMLLHERQLRKDAYNYYRKRLQSRIFILLDFALFALKK